MNIDNSIKLSVSTVLKNPILSALCRIYNAVHRIHETSTFASL